MKVNGIRLLVAMLRLSWLLVPESGMATSLSIGGVVVFAMKSVTNAACSMKTYLKAVPRGKHEKENLFKIGGISDGAV